MRPVRTRPIFNLRRRSLARGNVIVLASLAVALLLSRFPNNRATPLLALPLFTAAVATADTVRCMRKRWDFYHAAVILCLYSDLMALVIIAFLLIYPYAAAVVATR